MSSVKAAPYLLSLIAWTTTSGAMKKLPISKTQMPYFSAITRLG